MAHCELADIDSASFDFADVDDVPLGREDATTDVLIERGLIYASGRSIATDLVTAHMWFNIAAMRGDKEAARLRREVKRPWRARGASPARWPRPAGRARCGRSRPVHSRAP